MSPPSERDLEDVIERVERRLGAINDGEIDGPWPRENPENITVMVMNETTIGTDWEPPDPEPGRAAVIDTVSSAYEAGMAYPSYRLVWINERLGEMELGEEVELDPVPADELEMTGTDAAMTEIPFPFDTDADDPGG